MKRVLTLLILVAAVSGKLFPVLLVFTDRIIAIVFIHVDNHGIY